MEHATTCTCAACGFHGEPARPSLGWKLALAGVWVLAPVLLLGAVFTGLGVVLLGPLALLCVVFLYAPVAERALAEPRCPRCRRIVQPEAPARATATSLRGAHAH